MTNQTPSNSVVTEAMIEKLWRTARHQSWADFAKEVRLAMQSANTTGSACSLGEMHGMASCFTNAEGVRCCDFCGNPVTTESDELVERLLMCAEQSEMGRNCAATPHACREAAERLRAIATPDTDQAQPLISGDTEAVIKGSDRVAVLRPFIEAAHKAVAMHALMRAVPEDQRNDAGLGGYSTILSAAMSAASDRISFHDWQQLAERFAALSQPLGSQENSHGR